MIIHDVLYFISMTLVIIRMVVMWFDIIFFFQAEDGIRDLVRSRGLGDVYKRQEHVRKLILNISKEVERCLCA